MSTALILLQMPRRGFYKPRTAILIGSGILHLWERAATQVPSLHRRLASVILPPDVLSHKLQVPFGDALGYIGVPATVHCCCHSTPVSIFEVNPLDSLHREP